MPLNQALTVEKLYQDGKSVNERKVEQKTSTTQYVGVGDLRPGHRVFELDLITGIIQPAKIVNETAMIGAKRSYRSYIEFETRPNCFYEKALNAQNAERKFKQKIKLKNGKTIKENGAAATA